MSLKKTILFATGASGGHMFPALAAADELHQRGFNCVFVVGGQKFVDAVSQAGYTHVQLPAAPFNVPKNLMWPLKKVRAILCLIMAIFKAIRLIQHHNPSAIFGTGGYATVATVLAAKMTGVPVILHEQNVLPGRANRFLAPLANHIALTFGQAANSFKVKNHKMTVTGNPIRQDVLDKMKCHKPDQYLRVLVTGGSQGARVLSEVVPMALGQLDTPLKTRLKVVHQARVEDVEDVKSAYQIAKIDADVQPFIIDMGMALAASDIVISRAGAGAIVEISIFGKAAIYIPLPNHLADGHQAHNAMVAEDAGAALVLGQDILTPETLSIQIQSLLQETDKRAAMSNAAQGLFPIDAAKRVADVVQNVAKDDVMTGGDFADIR